MTKKRAAVIGATGVAGQQFLVALSNHPWFEVTEVYASEKSAGKSYAEAVAGRWKLATPLPESVRELRVRECRPDGLGSRVAFSGLDSTVAGPAEEAFARAGCAVVSNSRNHRMDADVPLLVPEVNPEHLDAINRQQYGRSGFIVTDPNCSTIGMVMALAPLHKKWGVEKVSVVTMQAVSGAGYPGVPSLDILDNALPYIAGEEEKMETEAQKILGNWKEGAFKDAEVLVSASCNRVAVTDGHLESVSFALRKKASAEEIKEAWRGFKPLKALKLPSAPEQPIVYREEPDRPQPRLDRMEGDGMSVVVGRLRPCQLLGWKMSVLSHNTIRGAAGAAILNAELLKAKGYI